jgi:hypothetical protein
MKITIRNSLHLDLAIALPGCTQPQKFNKSENKNKGDTKLNLSKHA